MEQSIISALLSSQRKSTAKTMPCTGFFYMNVHLLIPIVRYSHEAWYLLNQLWNWFQRDVWEAGSQTAKKKIRMGPLLSLVLLRICHHMQWSLRMPISVPWKVILYAALQCKCVFLYTFNSLYFLKWEERKPFSVSPYCEFTASSTNCWGGEIA